MGSELDLDDAIASILADSDEGKSNWLMVYIIIINNSSNYCIFIHANLLITMCKICYIVLTLFCFMCRSKFMAPTL